MIPLSDAMKRRNTVGPLTNDDNTDMTELYSCYAVTQMQMTREREREITQNFIAQGLRETDRLTEAETERHKYRQKEEREREREHGQCNSCKEYSNNDEL